MSQWILKQKPCLEEKAVSGKSGKVRSAKGYADIPTTLKFKLLNDNESQDIDKLKTLKNYSEQQINKYNKSVTLNLFEVRKMLAVVKNLIHFF